MRRPIYLDHHATTPVAPEVFEAMRPYFCELFGNSGSRHHAYGWEAAEAVETAREQVAHLIGVGPGQVYFTSGATESNNLAIKGSARRAMPGETMSSRSPPNTRRCSGVFNDSNTKGSEPRFSR